MTDVNRLTRLVARLPRMVTEEDDYAWVPLGDVLVAIADINAAEAAWPENGERIVLTTLLDKVAS